MKFQNAPRYCDNWKNVLIITSPNFCFHSLDFISVFMSNTHTCSVFHTVFLTVHVFYYVNMTPGRRAASRVRSNKLIFFGRNNNNR